MKILSNKGSAEFDKDKHHLWFRDYNSGVVRCAEVPKIIETMYGGTSIGDISIDVIEITEQYLLQFQEFIDEMEPQPLELAVDKASRLNAHLNKMFEDLLAATRNVYFVLSGVHDVNNHTVKLRTSYVID